MDKEDEKRDRIQKDKILNVIMPYAQIVDSSAICLETGLKLNEIWRYFRYTWSIPTRSVPGRAMPILIRDSAKKSKNSL